MSDTPRTDAVYEANRFQEAMDLQADLAALARKLERELAEARTLLRLMRAEGEYALIGQFTSMIDAMLSEPPSEVHGK